jgi:hypothetical protein
MPIAPFGPDAITFSFGEEPLPPVVSLVQKALANRLSLVPTGQTAARVRVTIGPERILRPVERPGAGGIVIPGLCGMTTSAAPQDRQLYDVALRGDAGWRIVAPHAVYHRHAWTDFGIARREGQIHEIRWTSNAPRTGSANHGLEVNVEIGGTVVWS